LRPTGTNRFELTATLVERAALRFTPAGLPALDLRLAHESVVVEDGQPRKVSMEIKALAIGAISRTMQALALGQVGRYAGFLTSTRNQRGLLFHITSVQPGDAADAPPGSIN